MPSKKADVKHREKPWPAIVQMLLARAVVSLFAALSVVVLFSEIAFRQERAIDPATSKIIIHVSKAGLFSALGDNHEIHAAISGGAIDEANRHVKFVVFSRSLKVLDPQLALEKREQVQAKMAGPEVLDVEHFPQISFESNGFEQNGSGQMTVRGLLMLHGVTKPVTAVVRKQDNSYVGTATLRQRDFGITPITIAGGAVKVKDELKIDFEVRTKAEQTLSAK